MIEEGSRTSTEFEKPRGVSTPEIRTGYAQVQAENLPGPLSYHRLRVLKAIAEAGISIDFLKLTQTGLAFVIPESEAESIEAALADVNVELTILKDRCIFLAHAVNMRDEDGLLAAIISEVIATGAPIGHMGDMHDRLLVVTDSAGAQLMQERIQDVSAEAWG